MASGFAAIGLAANTHLRGDEALLRILEQRAPQKTDKPVESSTSSKPLDFALHFSGGEVVQIIEDTSQNSVLWGELFSEKERAFFKRTLVSEKVHFQVDAPYEVFSRCLWQKQARVMGSQPRGGRFVVFLHPLSWKLNTSWAWAKFMHPCYKQDFSSVSVDLPGCGRSMVGKNPNVAAREWRRRDWFTTVQSVEQLGVTTANFVAAGEACGTVLRLLKYSPDMVCRRDAETLASCGCMVFIDPVFEITTLYDSPIGMAERVWHAKARDMNQDALTMVILNRHACIWAIFTRKRAAETSTAMETLQLLGSHKAVSHQITITEVGKDDLSEAQIGANVDKRFYFPCKRLKHLVVSYLKNDGYIQMRPHFEPADAEHFRPHESSYSGPSTQRTVSMQTSARPTEVEFSGFDGTGPRSVGSKQPTEVGGATRQLPALGSSASAPEFPRIMSPSTAYRTLADVKGSLQLALRPATAELGLPPLRLPQSAEGTITSNEPIATKASSTKPPTVAPGRWDPASNVVDKETRRQTFLQSLPGFSDTKLQNLDLPEDDGTLMKHAHMRASNLVRDSPEKVRKALIGTKFGTQAKKDIETAKIRTQMQGQVRRMAGEDMLDEEKFELTEVMEDSVRTYEQERIKRQEVELMHKKLAALMTAVSLGDGANSSQAQGVAGKRIQGALRTMVRRRSDGI